MTAARQIQKLDRLMQVCVVAYLEQIAGLDNPRIDGKPLKGRLAELWWYQINEHRVVCAFAKDKHVMFVVGLVRKVVRKQRCS